MIRGLEIQSAIFLRAEPDQFQVGMNHRLMQAREKWIQAILLLLEQAITLEALSATATVTLRSR